MYKKDIIITFIVAIIASAVSFFLSLDFQYIAGAVIDIMAIASAVYLAIYPLLQGSNNLVRKLETQDTFIPRKTQMGVLNTYLKVGLIMGVFSIILGCINLLIIGSYAETISKQPIWYTIFSAISIGQFAANFPLLVFVGKFMVFRVAFNR